MRHVIVWSLLLAVLSPAWLSAQDQFSTIEEFDRWLVNQLGTISDPSQPIERRSAARDQIILEAGPGAPAAHRTGRAEKVAARIRPLVQAQDRVTALDAIYIAARMRHAYLVSVLEASLASNEAMVRYWAAKGLSEARLEMVRLGGAAFFNNPIKSLAAQATREDSPHVAREIYGALSLGTLAQGDQGRPIDPLKIKFIHDQFMAAFKDRILRLDQGKADSVLAEVAGLKASAEWHRHYRSQKAFASAIINQQALLLKWAAQYYDCHFGELTEERKVALEQVVLKGAEVISAELNPVDPGFLARIKQNLAARGDRKQTLLTVIMYVGGPGMSKTGGWKLQKDGITEELPDLKDWVKASQPASSTTQPDDPAPAAP